MGGLALGPGAAGAVVATRLQAVRSSMVPVAGALPEAATVLSYRIQEVLLRAPETLPRISSALQARVPRKTWI